MAHRKYAMSDAVLLETADVITGYLKEDIGQFTTFDSEEFPDILPDIIKEQVTQAFVEGGDKTNITQISIKTDIVNQEIKNCRIYLEDIKYWVKKSFADSPAIQKQFGINQVKQIFGTQLQLIQFMENLPEIIALHRQQLDASGTPSELLDRAEVLAKTLREANIAQEYQKGNRRIDTEFRILHLNNLYDLLRKIDQAALSIYRNQPTKRLLYKISRAKNSGVDH
ncbi:hypothetical protein [Aquimarina sediminis]|uniref:hypothetical protein n=1 Tax=Aquimarina sediminis TaxID=2070536 RepID=UPI000CA08D82|nr:hypothetical protein [Aquimarina sediminis]